MMQDLRTALLRMWANDPMLVSFIVSHATDLPPDLALHVVAKQKPELLERLIRDAGIVKTIDELKELVQSDRNHPALPGPFVGATLYYCEETRCAAMIHNGM